MRPEVVTLDRSWTGRRQICWSFFFWFAGPCFEDVTCYQAQSCHVPRCSTENWVTPCGRALSWTSRTGQSFCVINFWICFTMIYSIIFVGSLNCDVNLLWCNFPVHVLHHCRCSFRCRCRSSWFWTPRCRNWLPHTRPSRMKPWSTAVLVDGWRPDKRRDH